MALLNLNNLLTLGNGSTTATGGLVNVTVPGAVDATVLPGQSGLLGGLGNVLGGVVDPVTGLLGNTLGTVTGTVNGLTGGLLDSTSLGGVLGNTTSALSGLLNGVTSTVGQIGTGLGTTVGDLGSGLGSAVGDLGSGLGSAVGDIGAGLGDLLGGLGNSVGTLVINILGGTEVTGTASNDYLQGTAGADRLYGGGGDDILDGMAGFDTGIYQGNHTDYTLSAANGVVTVKDNVANRDGTDSLRNMEFLQFKDGGVDIATGTFVSQTILDQTDTAYRAVIRAEAPGGVTEEAGVGIANGQFTFGTYVNALIQDASHSTVPSILVAGLVSGSIPTSDKLDSLASFAQNQYDYYKNVLGSAFADLGPYEALGRGFATTSDFTGKFGSGTDANFVSSAYTDVFGHAGSASQLSHFQAQVTFYNNLFKASGIADANIQARGAIYGQMVAAAESDSTQPYHTEVTTILTGFANGDTSHYGATFGA